MTPDPSSLLARSHFPHGDEVDLAVSGGGDSLGLLLLATAAGRRVVVHHVDHHSRATSSDDARFVEDLCTARSITFVGHDVVVNRGPNFEARARAARRAVLPAGALSGHTMDDLAETVLLNLLRGAGYDGLSPFVDSPTKPLRDLRREEVRAFVAASGLVAREDETNQSPAFVRNRVRRELVPLMADVAGRDPVPILARQAALMYEERRWLDELARADAPTLEGADCRTLRDWPRARLRRWLRDVLAGPDAGDGVHPPSADEVERAIAVVEGHARASELSGGRRLTRSRQRLDVE